MMSAHAARRSRRVVVSTRATVHVIVPAVARFIRLVVARVRAFGDAHDDPRNDVCLARVVRVVSACERERRTVVAVARASAGARAVVPRPRM